VVEEMRAMSHDGSHDHDPLDVRQTDTVLGALLRLREALLVLWWEILAPVRPLITRVLDGLLRVLQRIAPRER